MGKQSEVARKEDIFLESMAKNMGQMEQATDIKISHNFSDGVYIREMSAVAGTVILGKRHRHETCNILMKGKLRLYMGHGLPDKIIEAPMIFNSKPGVRKLAYVIEDTLFLNVHPTTETNLELIEKEFIISDKEYIEAGKEALCLGSQQQL